MMIAKKWFFLYLYRNKTRNNLPCFVVYVYFNVSLGNSFWYSMIVSNEKFTQIFSRTKRLSFWLFERVLVTDIIFLSSIHKFFLDDSFFYLISFPLFSFAIILSIYMVQYSLLLSNSTQFRLGKMIKTKREKSKGDGILLAFRGAIRLVLSMKTFLFCYLRFIHSSPHILFSYS